MLSDRRQRILCALIEEYVANALPVGSRTITERYGLGVSPATVRNELSALEEEGYITQPHTSAGRIPTDAGYRQFVDRLVESGIMQGMNPYEPLLSQLKETASAIDDLIEKMSMQLTKLTDCLSIVTAPVSEFTKVRQISLVSLSNRQALAIVVGQDGQVINESFIFDEDVTPARLSKVERTLKLILQDNTLDDLKDEAIFQRDDTCNDLLVKKILEALIPRMKEAGLSKTARMGMSALMKKPEFHNSEALLPIMEILEDDTVLFSAFDSNAGSSGDVVVRIGGENAKEGLSGVSVVAGTYGMGSSRGIVAVIGPKRMDYSKVIESVIAAKTTLNKPDVKNHSEGASL